MEKQQGGCGLIERQPATLVREKKQGILASGLQGATVLSHVFCESALGVQFSDLSAYGLTPTTPVSGGFNNLKTVVD